MGHGLLDLPAVPDLILAARGCAVNSVHNESRETASGGLRVELCGHRHAAAGAEGALGEFDAGGHLAAFEFVAVETLRHPADGFRRKLPAERGDGKFAFDQAFE